VSKLIYLFINCIHTDTGNFLHNTKAQGLTCLSSHMSRFRKNYKLAALKPSESLKKLKNT
uniref:Uncharacterized protein n=1 Tax=Romanomermis culicivorax TaxID=13658 RepID=A0A915L7K5_ROMCU